MLLTTAGMQPFKPYFLGREKPPAPRLTDVQKCFRTTDIEEVGKTARHLTFFEMLGNLWFGDYFKAEAIEFALGALARRASASTRSEIWVTVFGGDEELGLGPDEEAIEIWRAVGVPARADRRSSAATENFWQGGPTGPCGPVLGALPRPRPRVRHAPTNCPATRASASSSSGTTSSCSTTRTRRRR